MMYAAVNKCLGIIAFVAVFMCFNTNSALGQYELSTGIDLNYPLLLNSNNSSINYGQIGFGINFGIAYKPEETQFFPILKTGYGRTRLPLKEVGRNVAVLNFTYLNEMLNENFIVRFTNSELFIYGGIGFSYLSGKGIKLAGPSGDQMSIGIDSLKNSYTFFPAVNIGFEYNYGESAGKDLYLTMGINFQYIMLLDKRNEYYFHIKDPSTGKTDYNASLTGNAITPGFYIALHYLLHFHKKSGMYL